MPKIFFPVLVLVILAFSFRQDHISQNAYFIAPIKGTLKLSGTFGELRPQHFHAGIDLKAPIGTPIQASAEGYISKISVSPNGYGNVLYLQHPNGYTSVYAHLQSFHPTIAAYIKKHQYYKQSFKVELSPPIDSFRFQQGDVIGKLGVSGRSFGPHLHFEIRHTASELAINPLSFNLLVSDTRPPKIKTLKYYAFDEAGNILHSASQPIKKQGKYYNTKEDTLLVPGHHIGFAVEALDQLNGAYNWNGAYEILLYQDDNLRFQTQMEYLPIKQLRFLNAHIDYSEWARSNIYLNRCFLLPINELESIYPQKNGFLQLAEGQKSKINIIVKDHAGNSSNLVFWVKKTDAVPTQHQAFFNYQLKASIPNGINQADIQLSFPAKTFYEDMSLHYDACYEDSYNIYSLVHQIHDNSSPLHYPFELAIRPNQNIPQALKNKAFLAHCEHDGSIVNVGGQWKGNWLYTQSRQFGHYYVAIDTIAPDIIPISFQRKKKNRYLVSFKIKDNFDTGGNAQKIKYEGWIDGKWVLFSYDAKNQTIKHQFEKTLPPGPHQLKLKVEDALGNISLFESDFMK